MGPNIRMYTTHWCPDCLRAKQFLRDHGLEFEEINIEESPGAVETEAGKLAQLKVPGVGSNSTWRSAPPMQKYWSQHSSWLSATMIEPRQPE